jgi:biotin carboxyl carrier protein
MKKLITKPVWGLTLALVLLGAAGYGTRSYWRGSQDKVPPQEATAGAAESSAPTGKVILSDQAMANLGVKAQSTQPQTFWKTIQVPGIVVDRPGKGDRSIVSPATGVIIQSNYVRGEIVRPGNVLFTLRLQSEPLHQTQSDLFKAVQDMRLAQATRDRLSSAGAAIPGVRLIEVDNQITRQEVAAKAATQELLNRGFTLEQIDRVTEGKFVTEVAIHVPNHPAGGKNLPEVPIQPVGAISDAPLPTFEVEEVKVELGQQVQAGQTLCLLANHQMLAVEGHAFRDETPLLERSVKEGWPVEVDFQEEAGTDWPPLEQKFRIAHLANTIDPASRTFSFIFPLENDSRQVQVNGRPQLLWRFRPGQKVRIHIRIEKLDNVFVLPAEAVAREGAEAFVFTQNVNTFERKPVRIVYQDRQHAVLANDGSLIPGTFVVQNVAAQLDRMAKSQSSSTPKGFHVHADGSLHKNEEEAK